MVSSRKAEAEADLLLLSLANAASERRLRISCKVAKKRPQSSRAAAGATTFWLTTQAVGTLQLGSCVGIAGFGKTTTNATNGSL